MSFVSYYTRWLKRIALSIGLSLFPYGLNAQPLETPSARTEVSEVSGQQLVTIRMESYAYTPSEVIVEAGKPLTITLINDSFLVPHNFLLDAPSGKRLVEAEVSSGDQEKLTVTLTEPGIYPFYCDKQLLFFPNHREEGMEGRFIVR
jgi:plastocyanin